MTTKVIPGPEVSATAASRAVILFICVAALMLSACGEKKRTSARLPAPPPTIGQTADEPSDTRPSTSTGREIKVDPKAKVLWSQTGYASWYGPQYHNRKGANGEVYDMYQLTAAHNTLPLNSIVRVTNLKTDHSTVVRITDRGPFVADRIIDLSMAAAKEVDVWRPGTAKVRLDVLETPGSIENGGRWCVQVGAFKDQDDALKLKSKLQRKYHTAKVLQFPGPTGFWVRVRVLDDDKKRAKEVAEGIKVGEGGVFVVRLD